MFTSREVTGIIAGMVLDGDRQRLCDAMESAIAERGITWTQAASEAGIAYMTLWRARKGLGPITARTARAIERVCRWPFGAVRALLAGEATLSTVSYTPADQRPPDVDVAVTEALYSIAETQARLHSVFHRAQMRNPLQPTVNRFDEPPRQVG